jgi:type VI secretion system protein ImpB
VVGVMGDFSGNPTNPLKSLKDRKFTQIDRDNFDDVMAKVSPELHYKAENTLAGDKSEMQVDLKFSSMEDFTPAKVADQVPALKKLLETRAKLSDLVSKVDRSENLEALLEKILKNEDELKKLSRDLGLDKKEGS